MAVLHQAPTNPSEDHERPCRECGAPLDASAPAWHHTHRRCWAHRRLQALPNQLSFCDQPEWEDAVSAYLSYERERLERIA